MSAQPAEQPALYLITQEGEVVARTPDLAQALREIERLELALLDVEKERRDQRAHIKRLLSRLDREDRESYSRRAEVEDIFNEWRAVCRHPNARLGIDRFDAIRAMLEIEKPAPYPREAFSAAIAGLAFDPYRKQRRNGTWEVFDDCELCFRSSVNMERYIKKAPRV